jgi:hypothetical protein
MDNLPAFPYIVNPMEYVEPNIIKKLRNGFEFFIDLFFFMRICICDNVNLLCNILNF